MADESAPETIEQDMELEPQAADASEPALADSAPATSENSGGSKRNREEEEEEENGGKKLKVDEKSVEEQRLENLEDNEAETVESAPVSLGPKVFESSKEMFDYFYKFLHTWPPSINVNKYEHIMLLELLKKGHLEPEKKIGNGVQAFQVRFHPQFRSRCFFLIRDDESVDDFSFRKCVDHILPLPENLQTKHDVNKALSGGGRGGRGHGHGRGRGRGGRWRH
ncbi:protein EMBRYO DEFECTIVE 514-like [Olea europaea var. sylvestris]|uniref:protein EMBRYO DEFECTIVE 514-like n=1 Tax=Olea europaea var. sylvestris TaxID=158386 RepID=UPI000C1CF508|nr:protein EMBRYO DEFECTIVE 514-like [Olea europaea var. sylvestris]